jgi:hypothetical protein
MYGAKEGNAYRSLGASSAPSSQALIEAIVSRDEDLARLQSSLQFGKLVNRTHIHDLFPAAD